MGRRAKALMELPMHLTRCQTPQHLINAQVGFFQDAMRDWQSSTERLWQSWTGTAQEPRNGGAARGGNGRD